MRSRKGRIRWGKGEVVQGYAVKRDVEEVRDGFVEVDGADCWTLLLLHKIVDLGRVGPSLLFRNTLFIFCSLLYKLYRGTGYVD